MVSVLYLVARILYSEREEERARGERREQEERGERRERRGRRGERRYLSCQEICLCVMAILHSNKDCQPSPSSA